MKIKTIFIRISAFAVSLLVLISLFNLSILAEDEGIPCKSSDMANAIYLYNLEGNKVLFQKNADLLISPASTVKLMTALVAYETIPDLTATISVNSTAVSYTDMNVMSLEVGERISAGDLLKAMLCCGYNDAAVALAIGSCGSISAFVEKMNQKAVELGAKNTVYKDPTGLDDSAKTTVRDTFIIAREFYKNAELLEISSTTSFTVPSTNMSGERKIFNRNALMSGYTGTKYLNANAIGMNAGMTDIGGYCVVTGARKNDMTYICVVMGAKNDSENGEIYSYVVANELINYVTKTLGKRVILTKGQVISSVPVIGAGIKNNTVDLVPLEDVTASIPADFINDERFNITYVYTRHELKAPVAAGEKMGMIVVSYNREIVGIYDIVTAENVKRDLFISILASIRSFMFGRFFISFLCFFLILMIAYIFVIPRITEKRRRKRYRHQRYL